MKRMKVRNQEWHVEDNNFSGKKINISYPPPFLLAEVAFLLPTNPIFLS